MACSTRLTHFVNIVRKSTNQQIQPILIIIFPAFQKVT